MNGIWFLTLLVLGAMIVRNLWKIRHDAAEKAAHAAVTPIFVSSLYNPITHPHPGDRQERQRDIA